MRLLQRPLTMSRTYYLFLGLLVWSICRSVHTQDDESFDFTNGAVPEVFQLGQSYPNRSEVEECRPIRLHIQRDSRRFHSDLVYNADSKVNFLHTDAHYMTARLEVRVNLLAERYYAEFGVEIVVVRAWVAFGEDDDLEDALSLHYEGRSVRINVENLDNVSGLLHLAVEVGFDWVHYTSSQFVRLTVIPDVCDVSLDLVFMLDQSGSVGADNHDIALQFIQNVVTFYTIAPNATQVSLVTYSTSAAVEFDLSEHQDVQSLQHALGQVEYTGGWTATGLALFLTRQVLDPDQEYGARPFQKGIPRVAILITDGRSNILSIAEFAPALREFGVQVYTVGIGNIFLEELLFIASDPDPLHVFLLDSFSDASAFVDFLSFTTCDAPAIVEPGQNTTTEIEEDEFRFFQSECAAFSVTIMIEQIDLVGTCSLYASSTVQNPGPLDSDDAVIRNEDHSTHSRSVHLSLSHFSANRFVYVSVRGVELQNVFSIIIWDMIFGEDLFTVHVPADTSPNTEILDLTDLLKMTNVTFTYAIKEGNEEETFYLDPDHGTLFTTEQLMAVSTNYILLNIVAQNSEYDCHRGRVKVKVTVGEPIQFPNAPEATILENAPTGIPVTQVQAIGDSAFLVYAIVDGNSGGAFQIEQATGLISVAAPLDFETQNMYTLTIEATNTTSGASGTVEQVILVSDVNEPPFFVTPCAVANTCTFSVDENKAPHTLVDIIEANDPDFDTTSNGQLQFSLDPDSFPFNISGTGELRTTDILVHEDMSEYVLNIVVRDMGEPSLVITTSVTVQVRDIAPNADITPPEFLSSCDVSVPEIDILEQPLTQCIALDFNDVTNMTTPAVIYEIVDGNTGNAFAFASPQLGPGIIINQQALDREEVDSYNLTIQATDSVGLTGITTVTITILDINDNAPTFVNLPTSVLLTDSQIESYDASVITLQAVDADINENAQVQYSILETIRFPGDNLTQLAVIASDMGIPSLSSTAFVTIEFESPCVFQEYAVEATTGAVTSQLFCSVVVEPSDVGIALGGSQVLLCHILRTIDASYRWLHNGSFITSAVPLTSGEPTGDLLIFSAQFSDEGEYECEAISDLGSLLSNAAAVSILVPPTITFPPQDQAVEVGRTVQFTCFGTGVPDPSYSWLRPALPVGEVVLESDPDNRILPNGPFLIISQVQDGDQGSYFCAAINPAGEDRANATLIIFGLPDIVIVQVMNFSNPTDSDNSCQEFNSAEFETLMANITGFNAAVTDTSGDASLCNQTDCSPNPCQNGATCSILETVPTTYACECSLGYTGQNCESDIDECDHDPCQFGGTCTNTDGSFNCECEAGHTGDLCQYTDVCETQSPCPPGLVCVTTVTVSAGYVCETKSGVVVGGLGGMSPGALDGQVNTLEETKPGNKGGNNARRRRQSESAPDNGFVTQCEARFLQEDTSQDSYVLVWACPEGLDRPSMEEEERICQILFVRGFVTFCSTPSGVTLTKPERGELPKISLTISFLLVEAASVDPFSASTSLAILEDSDALVKLRAQGYEATSFSRAVPAEEDTGDDSDNRGTIAGIVIGVTFSIVMVALILGAVYVIRRKRSSRKKFATGDEGSRRVRMSAVDKPEEEENGVIGNPYVHMLSPDRSKPVEQAFIFPSQQQPAKGPIFDDSTYGRGYRAPDTHKAPKKASTLERGAKATASFVRGTVSSLKRKTESSSNLVEAGSIESIDGDSGDYEDVVLGPGATVSVTRPPVPPRHTTNQSYAGTEEDGSEGIYGNLEHHRLGAMGHAGERWESYWKTQTLFRTDEQTSPKK